MGEKMREKKGHKSEKHREETTELQKDEKELQKAKKKNKIVDKDRKADKIVEALKTTSVEGEEKTNLNTSGQKDSVDSLEEKQEKKKKEKKKKKEGVDGISSLIENFEDEKKDELVKGQGDNNNCQEGPAVDSVVEQGEKKKKKKKKKKEGADGISSLGENVEDDKIDELVKGSEYNKNCQDIPVVDSMVERSEKKKKRKREKEDGDNVLKDIVTDVQQLSKEKIHSDGKINEGRELAVNENKDTVLEYNEMGEIAKAQKATKSRDAAEMNNNKEQDRIKKKKKRKRENASGDVEETFADKSGTESTGIQDGENVEDRDDVCFTEDKLHEGKKNSGGEGNKKAKSTKLGKGDDCGKDKQKKVKAEKQVSDGKEHRGKPRTKKDSETTDTSENPTPQGKSKRVSFSDHVEVFSSSDGPNGGKSKQVEGLIRGKRFTPEEDEKVKKAVLGYIEERGLGEKGLEMVLNCKSYPEIKNCWKQIAASLPWRPRDSVYYRAHILFERDENQKWTPEEYEYVLKYHKEHGSDWKKLSKQMNKHRFHVKDTFRRIKFTSLNKGRWSQEEYQNLFDLVNKDLCMRASAEKKSKHGMLRDNICWRAISEKLSSRHDAACCLKWYKQLTSSMVAEGLWADTDDYRLLDALSELDAACIEDVDWDNLLEHREGDLCRQRWNQMVKHIGEYGNESFSEQVEILSNRYSIDILAAREEYDSKEPVDVIATNPDAE